MPDKSETSGVEAEAATDHVFNDVAQRTFLGVGGGVLLPQRELKPGGTMVLFDRVDWAKG